MEEKNICMVIHMAGCSEEEAKNALNKADGNVLEAIDSLVVVPPTVGAPKRATISDEQEFFTKLRKITDDINTSVLKGFTSSDQSTSSDQFDSVVSIDLPCLPEETVQQNNCFQECLPLAPQSEVQTQETACQLPCQYSCDSQ